MKKYLIKIFSVFLAVWMVTITGGLHLYAHECGCCDVQEVSVVNIDQCCSDDEVMEVCCDNEKVPESSCCEMRQITDVHESNICSTDNCCTVSHSYLKLDESFNVAGKILLESYPVLLKVVQVLNTETRPKNDFQSLTIINNSLPPGFTGRAFLIFTHTLKIPLS